MRTYFLIAVAALAILVLVSAFLPERPEPAPKTGVERAREAKSEEEAPLVTASKAAVRKVGQIYRDSAPWRALAGAIIKDVYNVLFAYGFLIIASPVLLAFMLMVGDKWPIPLVTDIADYWVPTPVGCLIVAAGWVFWATVPPRIARVFGEYDPFNMMMPWRPIFYRMAARLRESFVIAFLFGRQATGEWASLVEVLSNRYVSGDIFLGRPRWFLRPIGLPTSKHIITIAGTGAGKTTAGLIPNVCIHEGSLLCIDPKGEIAMITADRRGRGGLGQKVFVLDPFNIVPGVDSAYYNVFDEMAYVAETDPDAVYSYAGKIAQALVKPMNKQDTYWDNASQTFLIGLILYIFAHEPEERRNLVRLRQLVMEGEVEAYDEYVANGTINPGALTPFDVLLEKMIAVRKKDYGNIIAGAASSVRQMGPAQMGGVITSAQEHTSFLDAPALQRISLESDFLLARLKNRPTSVYVCLPINTVHGKEGRWLRMFVLLFIDMMMREQANPRTPVLLAIDEFPSLGRLEGIDIVAPVMRSYGVRFWAVAQDIDQLASVYPDCWAGFIGGAEVVQFMGVKHPGTVEFLSKLLGHHVVQEMDQLSGRTRKIERPLIDPNQISRLLARDQGNQIIWRGDKRPMLLKITPYYEYMPKNYYSPDPRYAKR